MYSFFSLVGFAALLLFEATSAAPTKLQPRSFKVERIQQGVKIRNAQRALTKSYSKWGMSLPAVLTASNAVEATTALNTGSGEAGEVTNQSTQGDVEFLAPISVGGQTLMVDFDTGSSDLWVFNTQLSAAEIQKHSTFDPKKSSTFKLLKGESYSISYGDGSMSAGVVGADTVNIGGATVTSQAVELPTAVSGGFVSDFSSNGLLGLAMSSLNTVKPNQQMTFFDNIRGSLALPVFTANLKHNATGFYEFGKIDTTQYTGSINYTPIDTSTGFWQFSSNRFSVGNGQVQQNTEGNPAIADTGTSLLLVDDPVIQGYYSHVEGAQFDENQGGITFPCDAALPDLHLALGPSYMATLSGDLMRFATVGNNVCFGSMQWNQGGNVQILGDIMFKSQFVVFNNGDATIGFAPHAATI
ncbi:hypothetical protein MMC26_007098 [Xylographa opegraphella]|nr:hypothetical protein [Xylographa opegraphella]